MTNSEIQVTLLRSLKVEMNGVVVQAMETRGLHYPMSYGVALPTIKKIAAEYAPNHSLSKLLYLQQVRELRLAALYIVDPQSVTTSELDFWGNGVINSEVAEVLAMTTLSKSPDAEDIVCLWAESDSQFLQYAALMTAARAARSSWKGERLCQIAAKHSSSDNLLLRRGSELLSERLKSCF